MEVFRSYLNLEGSMCTGIKQTQNNPIDCTGTLVYCLILFSLFDLRYKANTCS